MDPRFRTALRLVWTIAVAQVAFLLLLALFLSPAVAVGSVVALLAAFIWVARRRRKAHGAAVPSSEAAGNGKKG